MTSFSVRQDELVRAMKIAMHVTKDASQSKFRADCVAMGSGSDTELTFDATDERVVARCTAKIAVNSLELNKFFGLIAPDDVKAISKLKAENVSAVIQLKDEGFDLHQSNGELLTYKFVEAKFPTLLAFRPFNDPYDGVTAKAEGTAGEFRSFCHYIINQAAARFLKSTRGNFDALAQTSDTSITIDNDFYEDFSVNNLMKLMHHLPTKTQVTIRQYEKGLAYYVTAGNFMIGGLGPYTKVR